MPKFGRVAPTVAPTAPPAKSRFRVANFWGAVGVYFIKQKRFGVANLVGTDAGSEALRRPGRPPRAPKVPRRGSQILNRESSNSVRVCGMVQRRVYLSLGALAPTGRPQRCRD